MDRANQYKRLPLRLEGGAQAARAARALNIEQRRKEKRAQNVAKHRAAIPLPERKLFSIYLLNFRTYSHHFYYLYTSLRDSESNYGDQAIVCSV